MLILRLGGASKMALVIRGFGEKKKVNPLQSYLFISGTCPISNPVQQHYNESTLCEA